MRAALSDESKGIYFVAEIEGSVAGQLMITREFSDWRNGEIWWIQSVFVAAEFRRRGVFGAIYRHVRQDARRSGAVSIRLYVMGNNQQAQQTYARSDCTRPTTSSWMSHSSALIYTIAQLQPDQICEISAGNLSHDEIQCRFGRAGAIGKFARIDGKRATIVGVAQAGDEPRPSRRPLVRA